MYVLWYNYYNYSKYAMLCCGATPPKGSTATLCRSQARVQEEGWWRGAYTPLWKLDEWNSMAGEEEWMENTQIWKAKGKALDTNTGQSPGYQSQSQ